MTSKYVILVIDDDAMNREVMEAFLVAEQYQVILAHNGQQGLELAEQHKPDLVILDVRMPDINGYEVCRQLKQQETTRTTSVMIVTGYDAREDRQKGLDAGADDFLPRPFDGDDLLNHVRALLTA